ncbi:hypothetical protein Ancab_006569, partial [Ancistrocladus abbreviatus]
ENHQRKLRASPTSSGCFGRHAAPAKFQLAVHLTQSFSRISRADVICDPDADGYGNTRFPIPIEKGVKGILDL